MTPEELMMPRVKVTNYYPNSKFETGDILQKSPLNYYFKVGVLTSKHTVEMVEEVDKSPAIFQPLPWYAERKIEDMPEYIRSWDKPINHYTRFSNVVIKCGVDVFWNSTEFTKENGFVSAYGGICIWAFIPATKQDYEAYLKTNK